MAVLVEAISVVVRLQAVHDRFPGGWAGFREWVQNQTLCTDNELIRVGFMTPTDVQRFIRGLEDDGLAHLRDGNAEDIVVMDQNLGPTSPCLWAEFGQIDYQGDPRKRVSTARLVGSTNMQLWTPEGWTWEASLSRQSTFVPSGQVQRTMTFLGREDGMDVYLNRLTGQKVFVARSDQDDKS